MESNDEIDEQAEGLGCFACLSEQTRERFAWGVRMPFTPASTVDHLRNTVARGKVAGLARTYLASLAGVSVRDGIKLNGGPSARGVVTGAVLIERTLAFDPLEG